MALFFAACSSSNQRMIDKLNDISYDFHYKNLDSTYYYAMLADSLSGGYDEGKAAALNNLAFYHIARMDYNIAYVTILPTNYYDKLPRQQTTKWSYWLLTFS